MNNPDDARLEHIPKVDDDDTPHEFNVVGFTVIGSHVWGTNHAESDVDTMAVVMQPTRRVLDGTAKLLHKSIFKSETDHGWPLDCHVHEVGRVVPMLVEGNVNFVVGVMSPLVKHMTPAFEDLRSIVAANPSKGLYKSTRGMALSNIARYSGLPRKKWEDDILRIVPTLDIDERRCAKTLRYLEFGVRHLRGEPHVFGYKGTFPSTPQGIVEAITALDIAYVESKLPEKGPAELLQRWLYLHRLRSFAETETRGLPGEIAKHVARHFPKAPPVVTA